MLLHNEAFKPMTISLVAWSSRLHLMHHVNMICSQLQQLCHFMCTAYLHILLRQIS